MQNIIDILKDLGIEVPEDKTSELNQKVAENYKTISEFNKKVTKAEQERDNFKEQLETATETLKSFEGIDPAAIQAQLADWQKKAEDAEKNYASKLAERDFEDALKTAIEDYKFSSSAAKQAVMSEIRAKGLKLEDGKILGLNDLMTSIKERDADAFVDAGNPPAKFTHQMNRGGGGKKYSSKDDIMKIKDPTERQQAIAENLDLFTRKE